MELPRRKSPRIPGYSYKTPNYYFITICTHNKACIFGKPGALNTDGKYAEENLQKIAVINPNIHIDQYVIMPNHVHMILVISASSEEKAIKDVAVVIGQYKMSVTKRIREKKPGMKVWQRSFHDHVIRSQKSYENIWNYIAFNPQKWENDCFYTVSFE